VDITRGEHVEAELDAMIRRRHDQRVQTEGERLEEELWQESVDRSTPASGRKTASPCTPTTETSQGLCTPGRRSTSSGQRSSASKQSWGRGVGS
jgi:hypothetical protein